MKPERKAQEKYWNLIQIIDEKRKTSGVNDIKISYSDLKQNPSIHSSETGIVLLERLEREKGIKILERPTIDPYIALMGFTEGNFSIKVLQKFDSILKKEHTKYVEIADDYQNEQPIIESKKNESIIKAKSLELIARKIGNLDSAPNLKTFLTDCGVEKKLIEYPNTKWRMIYTVLIILATSQNPKDQETLFKIIEEASHPLIHNGDEELAKVDEDEFNKLLKYDGFTLKNYKVKKINKEIKQDNDLDLYLKKKILVENWRDDVPHPITELSFNNNEVEQICYSLWDLFVPDIISFGANTFPENILIETDPRFHKEIAFNWNLIRDLDNNPNKVEADYGFDIEILDEERLQKDIGEEVNEFIDNKVKGEKIEAAKDFYADTKHLETPSYLRDVSHNYYAYKKQKEILLEYIAALFNQFENEILVIKFNEIKDPNVNVLRTLLALESEGFFTIKELRNDKKEWTDKDNIYIKIQLVKSKIPTIKKCLSAPKKEKSDIKKAIDSEPTSQTREPLHVVIDEVKTDIGIRGFEEKVVLPKPKNKKIQLRKFPSDLRWEEISIQFLNEHEVIIKPRNETFQSTYELMGFQDGKRKLPNKQWIFLRLLATKNGELSWENNNTMTLKKINAAKKQKQLLADSLKAFFQIGDDPFEDYRKEKAYKIKINLILEADPKERLNEDEIDGDNDDLGIKESLKQQAPEVYDE